MSAAKRTRAFGFERSTIGALKDSPSASFHPSPRQLAGCTREERQMMARERRRGGSRGGPVEQTSASTGEQKCPAHDAASLRVTRVEGKLKVATVHQAMRWRGNVSAVRGHATTSRSPSSETCKSRQRQGIAPGDVSGM